MSVIESEIVAVKNSILSAEDIKGMSCAQIIRADVVSVGDLNTFGSLSDPRLGDVRRDSAGCSTCDMSASEDQGHMGHFEFIVPIYNPLFAPQKSSQGKYLLNILNMTCLSCGASLLVDTDSEFYKHVCENAFPDMKFKEIKGTFGKIAKECPDCGIDQPQKYEFTENSDVVVVYKITAAIKDLVLSWVYNTVFVQAKEIVDLEAQVRAALEQKLKRGDVAAFTVPRRYIYDLLCRIPDSAVSAMGLDPKYSRPESMMFRYFPIPPPHVRPTHFRDTRSSEDDFTGILRHIITKSTKLREKVLEYTGSGNAESLKTAKKLEFLDEDFEFSATNPVSFTSMISPAVSRLIHDVQKYVNCYIADSNTSTGVFKNSPKFPINFRMRYQPGSAANGKGRIRGTLSGKRTENSLRSVIGGHMETAIDEVGLPLEAAMRLTVAEVVSRFNFDKLQRHVNNGRDKYPGALYMQDSSKRLIALKGAPRHRQIREGDIVYRHLVDGDVVFMNRQPSLHKLSMMGHRVRVVPGLSIRLNIGATDPYGADFDGDEMHVYVPQSPEAIREVRDLGMVSKNFIRPSNARPAIKLVQDGALGVYLLGQTRKIPRQVALDLLATSAYAIRTFDSLGESAGDLVPESGVDVLRRIFRKNYVVKDSLTKREIADVATRTYFDVSAEEALAFMSEVQFITRDFINYLGATIGARDMRLPEVIEREIRAVIERTREQCTALQIEYRARKVAKNPYLTLEKELDFALNKIIKENMNRLVSSVVSEHLVSDRNGIYIATSLAGSKGKLGQLTNMIVYIGQQSFKRSSRTPFAMNGDRTLAYYPILDNSIEARGFIASNWANGYTLSEAYHIARAGRDSLVDTTHKTQTTGYFNRRIGKNSESLVSVDDYTVRRDNNSIVMTAFGYDSLDCQHIVRDSAIFRMYTTSMESFKQRFFGRIAEENELLGLCRDRILSSVRGIELFAPDTFTTMDTDGFNIFVPISVPKTIETAQLMFPTGKAVSARKAFAAVLDTIIACVPIMHVSDKNMDTVSLGRSSELFEFRRMVLATMFMPYLCTRELERLRVTKTQLDYVLAQVIRGTIAAYTPPGKNIGIESAITIGEQSTQEALDSFHSSGSAESSSAVSQRSMGISSIFEINTLASKYEGEQAFTSTGTAKAPKTKTKNKTPRSKLQYPDKLIRVFLRNPEDEAANRKFVNLIRSVRLTDIAASPPAWHWDPKADNIREENFGDVLDLFELENGEPFVSDTLDFGEVPDAPPGWTLAVSDYVLRIDISVLKVLDLWIDTERFFARMDRIFNDDSFISGYSAPWSSVLIAHGEITDAETFPCFIRIRPNEYSSSLVNLLDRTRRVIMNIFVNGPNRTSRVSVEKKAGERAYLAPIVSPESGMTFESIPFYVIQGVRLIDLVSDPFVNRLIDLKRLTTNDYIEFYDMLGCSAATKLMCRDAYALYGIGKVLPRHISLVIKNMTRDGEILPLKRNGTELITPSVLAKASNEQPILNLVRGAVSGSEDSTRNVSTAVITGTPFKTGSRFSVPVPVDTDIGVRKQVSRHVSVHDLKKRIEAENLREIISSSLAVSEIQKIFIDESQFLANAMALA